MKFPCPQCGLSRQFEIKGTATEISGQRCRRCASKITIKRVSNRRKHVRKQTVLCSACGSDFLFSSACPICKAPFTGYLQICADLPRSSSGVTAENLLKPVEHFASRWALSATTRIKSVPARIRVVSALFALVLALSAAGTSYYNHRQNERNYLKNYVLTLYGIKTGFDRGNSIGNDLVTESLRHGKAGYYPSWSVREKLEEHKTVQTEVERLMKRMTSPPESLRDASTRLQQLYFLYMRQNLLVTAPRGSVDDYEHELQEVRKVFLLALRQLTVSLPPQLQKEVEESGKRYNLKFLQ